MLLMVVGSVPAERSTPCRLSSGVRSTCARSSMCGAPEDTAASHSPAVLTTVTLLAAAASEALCMSVRSARGLCPP